MVITNFRFGRTANHRPITPTHRILLTLAALLVLGMGVGFAIIFPPAIYSDLKIYQWDQTPCRIISSQVTPTKSRDGSTKYQFGVSYSVEHRGKTWTSSQFSSRSHPLAPTRTFAQANRYLQKFPAGTNTICYVNPDGSMETILERPSLVFLIMLLLPIGFLALGIRLLLRLWWPGMQAATLQELRKTRIRATSGPGGRILQRSALILVPTTFAAVTAYFGYFELLLPYQMKVRSQNWNALTCSIISSQIVDYSCSGNNCEPSYGFEIVYRYLVAERPYTSSRYNFGERRSGLSYAESADIVDRFPVNTQVPCYVNPINSDDVVLERSDFRFGENLLTFLFLVLLSSAAAIISFLVRSGPPTESEVVKAMMLQQQFTTVGRTTFGSNTYGTDSPIDDFSAPETHRSGGIWILIFCTAIIGAFVGILFSILLRQSAISSLSVISLCVPLLVFGSIFVILFFCLVDYVLRMWSSRYTAFSNTVFTPIVLGLLSSLYAKLRQK